MTTMESFLCWRADAVRRTVYSDIGALPGDADAVFLAAHTPMSLKHINGAEVVNGDGSERDVLRVLLAGTGDPDRNTLIAVTGAPGAGKSHVVRWVHAHLKLDESRFHVLYVPRAIQTIRELLRRIVQGLPGGGGQEILKRVDAAVAKATPAELRDRLLEEMRFALTWNLQPKPPTEGETEDEFGRREERNNMLGYLDDQGKRRHGLADLLAVPPVNQALLRPGRALDNIVNSVYAETSRRDVGNRFEVDDLPLREAGVRSALRGDAELLGLWTSVGSDPDIAVDLLNEAVQEALRRALGLRATHGETLDVVFEQARRALRREGKELVLLFEDLAQFGLIDGELYDQFSTQPGTDMAPLRAVFAVTDDPFQRIVGTVRSRLTHRFEISDDALANREVFVARYLNLVRLGRDGVEEAWLRASSDGDQDWVKNACDSNEHGMPCPVRSKCHAGFGAVDVPGLGEVGLYPYNDVAMRRALQRPTTDGVTPRSDLDVCVSETLSEAHAHIGRGTYPHPLAFEKFNSDIKHPKAVVLDGRTGAEAERLYRALVLWGDEAPLGPAVVEAFKLGDVLGTRATETSEVAPRAPLKVLPGSVSGHHATPAPPQRPVPATESPLRNLFQWENGEHLTDREVKYYRSAVYGMVKARLNFDHDLIHLTGVAQELIGKVFNVTSFDFGKESYGRTAARGAVKFRFERTSSDVKVLAAAHWFKEHGHWVPEKGQWPWPAGYDPVDLMLTLEQRLDEWAAAVRTEVLTRRNTRDLAQAAVGARAIALVCAGEEVDESAGLRASLTAKPASAGTPSTWSEVDQAARSLLERTTILELVGDLASVRQGDGDPQLIDVTVLDRDLGDALAAPTRYLRQVAEGFSEVEPILAVAAKSLLTAVEQCADEAVSEARHALEVLERDLAGGRVRAVAKAAEELGARAVKSGFLRPPDGYSDLNLAVDVLKQAPVDVPLRWTIDRTAPPGDEAVRIQRWMRTAIRTAGALTKIRQTVDLTREECLRNTPESGDLDQCEMSVRRKLGEVEYQLRMLGGTGDPHD
ncbi:ATP-binding protein [Amycolatopsis nigrescens]|uniref:ATP-binding protein n=1 Tax=Amycolatopsis nigrescens TaxID=381445 RepID=UPI00036B42D8|nr:ATP-binding protein [Amycolatopsis nigrescens]